MAVRTGRIAIIEQLLADGIRFIFGNPGTVEESLLDALSAYPNPTYILALQETVAVGMADGYARATRKPAIVQLHSGVGLGNGIGLLYQAKRGHTPMVVLSGEAGLRYDAMDAQMAADLVAMARPVTKWATRVVDPSSLLRILRRALKMAATPPMGPVFVSLPMDILDAPNNEDVLPTSFLETRTAPQPELIDAAAHLLAEAQNPMIIMGDGIAFSGAQDELARVAESIGARVWGADSSEVNMSATHPLYRDMLGHMFGDDSRAITSQADAVLISGTYVFPEVFPALSGTFAPGAKVVHIDLDSYEVAKNFPVTLGLISDPKTTLARLANTLQTMMSTDQKAVAASRFAQYTAEKDQQESHQRDADRQRYNAMPLHASRFIEDLVTRLPQETIIVDEALTVSPDLVRYIPPTRPGYYYLARGGSLGLGFPSAIGIKLAHPDKTVIGFSGDGASMYTIQALWTAAHYKIGAKFIVCNNQSYELLKLNLQHYWREHGMPEHDFPSEFDIHAPDLRFDMLAQGMGVQAVRIETPEQIIPAIERTFANDEPFLIDLVLTSQVPDHIIQEVTLRGCQA
jgi:benzoylformate decarboxylase